MAWINVGRVSLLQSTDITLLGLESVQVVLGQSLRCSNLLANHSDCLIAGFGSLNSGGVYFLYTLHVYKTVS